MDNNKGAPSGFGEALFSPGTMIMLLVAFAGVVGAAAVSSGPLRIPMLKLLGIVGCTYLVLGAVWHCRWGAMLRPALPFVLLGVFLLWGHGNFKELEAFYSDGKDVTLPSTRTQTPTPIQSLAQTPVPAPTPASKPTFKPTPVPIPTPKPVTPARPLGGVEVIVSDQDVDARLRQDIERVVKREVGAQQRLQDVFVEVDVESLRGGRSERAPGKGDLSSTGAHAKVSIIAYAANSNRVLHKVKGTGRSVAFQGQELPMDQMKREALSDALESAFKQIR